jgi:hypothetical protein
VKQKLRIQAARHGRSMEAEAREILSRAVEAPQPAPPRTVEEMRERLLAVTGIWKDRHAGKTTDEVMKELRGDD